MENRVLFDNFNVEGCPSDIEAEVVSELVTINDVIRYATSYLIENDVFLGHGTDNYWEEATCLVLCMLNLDPTVGSDSDTLQARLTDREKRNIARALTVRAKDRIPTAYITHRAWFCDIEFYVDERVIIPRSPIAELIKNQFAPYYMHTPSKILDMCTGSGCIALACANQFPDAYIDAVDISEDALAVCEVNIDKFMREDQVFPIKSDLFKSLPLNDPYDIIVCNPPYVDAYDLEDMPAEFQTEPKLALEAGEDGLDLVKKILAEAPNYLAKNGILVMEVGNSMLALEEQFPEVEFNWVEFKNGGDGVFVMTYGELLEYSKYFAQFIEDEE